MLEVAGAALGGSEIAKRAAAGVDRALQGRAHGVREPRDTLEIFGSRGSIHVPVLNEGTMRAVDDQGERTEAHPPDANLHAPLIRDFAAAVIDDREPAVSGEIGRAVAKIEEEIYRQP